MEAKNDKADDGEQRFFEGDVIVVRGNEYEVEQVDIMPDGGVLQYRLDSREEGLAGTLKPERDGENVIVEYHSVSPDDITVIE